MWEFTFRESQLNVQIKMLTTTSYFYLLNIRGDIIQNKCGLRRGSVGGERGHPINSPTINARFRFPFLFECWGRDEQAIYHAEVTKRVHNKHPIDKHKVLPFNYARHCFTVSVID